MGSGASGNAQILGASKEQLTEFYKTLTLEDQQKVKAVVSAIQASSETLKTKEDLLSFIGSMAISKNLLTGKIIEDVELTMQLSDSDILQSSELATKMLASLGQAPSVRKDACRSLNKVLLIGPAGSGKSCFSRQLTRIAVKSAHESPGSKVHPVPIRVPLAELAQVSIANPGEITTLFSKWASTTFGPDAQTLCDTSQPLLLILDGLDEAGGQRPQIMAWLRQWLCSDQGLASVVLLTTRPSGLWLLGENLEEQLVHDLGFKTTSFLDLDDETAAKISGIGADELAGMPAEVKSTPLFSSLLAHYMQSIGGAELSGNIAKPWFEVLVLGAANGFLLQEAAGRLEIPYKDLRRGLSIVCLRLLRRDGTCLFKEEDLANSFDGQGAALFEEARLGHLRFFEPVRGGHEVQAYHLRLHDLLAAEAWFNEDSTLESAFLEAQGSTSPSLGRCLPLLAMLHCMKDNSASPALDFQGQDKFQDCQTLEDALVRLSQIRSLSLNLCKTQATESADAPKPPGRATPAEVIVDDEMEKRFKAAFDDIDKNNSGFIEAKELNHVLRHVGAQLTDEEMEGVFKAADVNGDQRLDMGEYMALVGKAMK